MTILIFCGCIGLIRESIVGNSFSRYVDRNYEERRRREDELNRYIRMKKRFKEKYCLIFPKYLDDYATVKWIAEHYNMSCEELRTYAVTRLKDILPNINLTETSGFMEFIGAGIRIIDDGLIPDDNRISTWGNTMFGDLTEKMHYPLKERELEDLCVWAAREMRNRGVPIGLVYKKNFIQPSSFNPLIYIDFLEDPIKCAKRYGIDDT